MDYNYIVKWCRRSKQFIGTCEAFPKLSFYASDREKAHAGIQKLVTSMSQSDQMKEFLVDAVPASKQLLLED